MIISIKVKYIDNEGIEHNKTFSETSLLEARTLIKELMLLDEMEAIRRKQKIQSRIY